MKDVQVELYLQDSYYKSSQEDADNLLTAENGENWFRRWLELLPDIPPAPMYEIGLLLCDDVEIQGLNTQYRRQNKPTDVLAFAALETNFPQPTQILQDLPLYLGDIAISVDTAKRQAQEQGHSLQTEIIWLMAHGLLHLVGWDHPDEESLLRMLKQQVILLKTIGISIDIE